jgi:alpha-amylase
LVLLVDCFAGQEQGYTGGGDPDNREALWLSGYVENKDLVNHVKALNLARKAAISANSKFLSTPVRRNLWLSMQHD